MMQNGMKKNNTNQYANEDDEESKSCDSADDNEEFEDINDDEDFDANHNKDLTDHNL